MACASYKPGLVMATYKPLVRCLLHAYRKLHCSYCFVDVGNRFTKCLKCKSLVYCSRQCKRLDWVDGHMLECLYWRSKYCNNSYFERDYSCILLRLCARLKMRPKLKDAEFESKCASVCRFKDLASFLKKDFTTEFQRDLKFDSISFGKFFEEHYPRPSKRDEILKYIKFVTSNLHPISVKDKFLAIRASTDTDVTRYFTKIGGAIYLKPNYPQHSCKPNAYICYIGANRIVRAITSIPKEEELTFSFIDYVDNKQIRKADLSKRFQIDCKCSLCESEDDSKIDYINLNGQILTMKEYCMKDTVIYKEWCYIYSDHKKILAALEIICNQYDRRITEQYSRILVIAIKLNLNRPKIEEIAHDTYNRMVITFGETHQEFTIFMKEVFQANGLTPPQPQIRTMDMIVAQFFERTKFYF